MSGCEKVYVDLDCLLDTRLGALAQLNPDYAVNALNQNYHSRVIDAFEDVDALTFKQAYQKRNADTLTFSVATNVFTLLQACIKGTLEDLALGGQNNGIIFEVNYYPYDLDEEEIALIREAILNRTLDVMDVNMVSIENKMLTPQFCKEFYPLMIRYDYVEWLQMFISEFEQYPAPTITLIAPALYFEKLPNEQELDEMRRNHIDAFRATEVSLAPVIGLKLMGADLFSIDTDIKPGKPKSSGQSTDGSQTAVS